MKQILLKIALFFSLLAIPLVTLFILPYSEEFAYHYIEHDCYNHGAWIYDRIVHNPAPIDIAFIGSSHTIHAYQDKKLTESLGRNYQITNLGYCRYGRNLEYTLLRMLLEHKTPKLIVIEVHEDEEKNSHDIFPYLAKTSDLLCPPTPINRDYFADLFNGASARLEYFKARFIFRKKYPEQDAELFGYAATKRIVTAEELKENESAWKKRLARTPIQAIEQIQMKYPFAYLEKMITLLKERNIPIFFVYLPEYGSNLKSLKYAEYYQDLAPLLIPPQSIFNDTANWMDASHLNDKGSEIFSEWMAEQLKVELCIEKKL
jgi:hypothetical protein